MKFAHYALTVTVLALAGCPPHDDDGAPRSARQQVGVSAADCFACSLWTNLGEEQALCDPPSKELWADLLACLRRPELDPAGGCEVACAAYVASYDACVASGDPACAPSGGSADCDACLESNIPYTAIPPGIGCGQYATPCSLDRAGCATCSAWIAPPGKTIDLVCPESYISVWALSACACQGPCSAPCGQACANPWGLDSRLIGQGCRMCLQNPNKCGAQYDACTAD